MPGKDEEWGAESEYYEEDGIPPAAENGYGKEAGQRKTPHDACRPQWTCSTTRLVVSQVCRFFNGSCSITEVIEQL
jgi:hypothetical protein